MVDFKTIGLILVVIIILYLVYEYYFKKKSDTTLVSSHDARQHEVISASSLPSGSSANYTFSLWFYINDWNYRFGESKVMFGRVDQNNDPAPSVTLSPSTNDLNVSLAVYPTTNTNGNTAPTLHTCTISDVPIQKWTNVILTINNRALDLYLDGKLVRTCVMPGVPKNDPTANIILCPDGGFSGFISNFRYIANTVNPNEAYNIYKAGYGSGSGIGSFFDKYRIKLSFLEDNKEVDSIEI
jgi:hypothetical protein